MRARSRAAVEIHRFVEAVAGAVGADLPPQRQRDVEEPAAQRCSLAGKVAHAARPGRTFAAIRGAVHWRDWLIAGRNTGSLTDWLYGAGLFTPRGGGLVVKD